MTTQPLKFESPDQGEELARADLYGLLATLFYQPPSQDLLTQIAQSQQGGTTLLEQAWSELANACTNANPTTIRDEYESLFIGVGKPELMLYGSYYLSGFLMEKPLAALRTDLAKLGLQRDDAIPETEDHIAALCEVMRYLIASGDPVHANVATQKQFFGTHIQPWASELCDAIAAHPKAVFYAPVARLSKAFFDIEAQAFDML
ncbi:molecular chaperone [Oxalobacteraceae bacterium OM1]|nr:molecular chaperone [Oxalobacteraceae bacterium OM1]